MAAKAKAPTKAKVKPVAKKATAAKAKPKGLQLTTAQQAAYNKVFNATATRLRNAARLQAAATGYRKGQLNAAHALVKQYNSAHSASQAAAIAAYAARRTWVQARLGHQNTALLARIEANMFHHATLAGQAQYVAAGIQAFAHQGIMNTVTQAQAVNIQAKFFNKVLANAKRAGASTRLKGKKTPLSKSIAAAAIAAGNRAAKSVNPRARTTGTGRGRGRPKGSKAGASTQKAVKVNHLIHVKGAAQSKKAPVKTAKSRTAPVPISYWATVAALTAGQIMPPETVVPEWLGDATTPNCIITAVANHLLKHWMYAVTDKDLDELTEICGEDPVIEEVLWQVWLTGWPASNHLHLVNYTAASDDALNDAGLVVGFATEYGDHAALSLEDGKVVSWGTVTERKTPVEEAWVLTWRA